MSLFAYIPASGLALAHRVAGGVRGADVRT